MIKNKERVTLDHKGVKITLDIDFDIGNVDIVDPFQGHAPKKFVFVGRGLDYMNGWLIVIEAMKVAVEYAKKELERDLAEKSAFKENVIKSFAQPMVEKSKKMSKNK